MGKAIVVRVTLHGRELKSYALDQDLVRIGRDPQCDICLPTLGVSRVHLQLRRDAKGFHLADSGSCNGTEESLKTGDRISIERFILSVEVLNTRNVPLLSGSAHLENANLPTLRTPEVKG
jgi:predicted component of type VI protein secretion system